MTMDGHPWSCRTLCGARPLARSTFRVVLDAFVRVRVGSASTGGLLLEHGGIRDEPSAQLLQGAASMRDRVLVRLRHLGIRLAAALLRLEDGVPAEVGRPSRWHDLAPRPPIENVDLAARAGSEGEDTLRIRALILVANQELVQAVVAKLVQEPLDVRPRQAPEGIVAETGVLAHHWALHLQRRQLALLHRDLLGVGPLELGQVDLPVGEIEGHLLGTGIEDLLHLL
mmetsp:Transcript_24710/g.70315  ORF Transcript_24710/g.70315 Transcript_24710/m.70315 type:complete len:227 (+) Transcript_24710:11-691(+)